MSKDLQTKNTAIKALPEVLLVDDEPRILRSMKAALKKHYDIFTAHNAKEAKSLIKKNKGFSVIISDERMPDILGHELLAWSKDNYSKMIRILMTGYSDIKAIQNSINEAEIYKYITKPWNVKELKSIIDSGIVRVNTGMQVDVQKHDVNQAKCALVFLNMVDHNDQIYTKVAKRLSMEPNMVHDIGSTLLVLENNKHAGVLFIDDDHVNEDTFNLVMLIHDKYPKIVIIVATSAADGKSAIKLLNQGQIFRYLVKPLTETKLFPMLNAAAQRFYKQTTRHDHLDGSMNNETSGSSIKSYWRKIISFL